MVGSQPFMWVHVCFGFGELLDVFVFNFFICRVQDCLVSGVATWLC